MYWLTFGHPGVALAEEKILIWLKPIKNIDLKDLRL